MGSRRADEPLERVPVGLLGAPHVEVVGVDGRDHGGVRRVDEERAVALVRLGDEQVAGALLGVAAGLGEVTADGVRRVGVGREQRDGEQRGRGGLAVRARDGDHPPALHQRLERGRARQQPEPAPHRLDHLGVVLAYGRGDDDAVGVPHLRGVLPDVDARTEGAQRRQHRSVLGVGAGDGDAAGQHQPGDAGQGGAADADEVHPAQLLGGQQHVGHGHPHGDIPAAASTIRASRTSASRGTRSAAAADMAARRSRVGEERRHVVLHPLRRQVTVVDEHASPDGDDRLGVARLLAVAVREGHEHRGQPHAGDLGHRVGTGAADDQVGGGVGEVHPLDVGEHVVGGVTRPVLDPGLLHPPRVVHHLHAGVEQRTGGARDGVVDPPRALRAAGHQQRRPLLVEPERAPRLGPGGGAIESGDAAADGQPGVGGVPQRGVREARRDVAGQPGTEAIRQARKGVALVHDQRQPTPPGRQVGRHGDVAAEADHDVGPHPVEDLAGGPDRRAQPARHPQQVDRGPAWQRHRRHQLERVARLRHHPGLQPAGRAQRGDLDVVDQAAQRVGRGQQRVGVSGGAPAGEQDADGHRRPPRAWVPRRRGSRSRRCRRCARSAARAPGSVVANASSMPRAISVGSNADPP